MQWDNKLDTNNWELGYGAKEVAQKVKPLTTGIIKFMSPALTSMYVDIEAHL